VKFRLEQQFDLPVDQVEAGFVDPDLFAHLGDLDEVGRPELLERVDDGSSVDLRVRYAFTGELAPALMAVVERERLTWVETSTLDRETHRTEFRVVPDHYPDRLRCAGTVVGVDHGSGSRRIAVGSIDVRIPWVRGRVERAIVAGLVRQADVQARIVRDWMASRRQAET